MIKTSVTTKYIRCKALDALRNASLAGVCIGHGSIVALPVSCLHVKLGNLLYMRTEEVVVFTVVGSTDNTRPRMKERNAGAHEIAVELQGIGMFEVGEELAALANVVQLSLMANVFTVSGCGKVERIKVNIGS